MVSIKKITFTCTISKVYHSKLQKQAQLQIQEPLLAQDHCCSRVQHLLEQEKSIRKIDISYRLMQIVLSVKFTSQMIRSSVVCHMTLC